MEDLIEILSSLVKRVESIEEKLNQLPIPFELMYRPPETETHVNVVQYLNEIDKRIKELENGNTSG